MKIARIIAPRSRADIITVTVDTPMREAVALLADKRIGALPVMDGERVEGIFSERDVVYRLASEGEACLARPVGEVMTSPAISVEPEALLDHALGLMTKRRIRHLPVCEGGSFMGFISIGDLVKARIEQVEREASELRSYIQTA